MAMKTLSLKLPDTLDARLTAIARRTRATKSAVVRDALEAFFMTGGRNKPVSAFDLAKDLIGSIHGPADLSSNKKHMARYGR